MKVTITPKAEEFMKRMVRFSGATRNAGFRLDVTPGGCSGFNSSFTIENAALEGDTVIEREGLKVFIPAESRFILEGVTVDFVDTPTSTGLTFINPKAQGCACSSSSVQIAGVSVTAIHRKP